MPTSLDFKSRQPNAINNMIGQIISTQPNVHTSSKVHLSHIPLCCALSIMLINFLPDSRGMRMVTSNDSFVEKSKTTTV